MIGEREEVMNCRCAHFAAFLGLLFSLSAASASNFYEGRILKVVTGGSIGAGYDAQTRLVAAHLARHIAGNPSVIVQNMPAGSGIASINHTYARAARDGTEIGQFNRDAMLARLLGHQQALFDLEEFNWLGSPASYSDSAWVVVIRSDLPHRTLDDLRKAEKPVVIGNVRSVLIPVLRNVLGANIKIIEGYEGRQMHLAFERGEVDGIGSGYDTLVRDRPDWIRDKKLNFIVQYGSGSRIKQLPDVPTAGESALNATDRELVEFCELSLTLGFPFAAPPGVPQDRVKILRNAFDATFRDPEYLAAAQRAGLETTPRSGEALAAAVRRAARTPPALIERYKQIAAEGRAK
jgi:tripartite-type tricarboxylate transporter receptor subunit TctC